MTGCPLDEKISEMHQLRREGDSIGALALVCVESGARLTYAELNAGAELPVEAKQRVVARVRAEPAELDLVAVLRAR